MATVMYEVPRAPDNRRALCDYCKAQLSLLPSWYVSGKVADTRIRQLYSTVMEMVRSQGGQGSGGLLVSVPLYQFFSAIQGTRLAS